MSQIPRYSDSMNHIINAKKFVLPDINDYYKKSVDSTYFDLLEKTLEEKDGDGSKAAFYVESPPLKSLGYHQGSSVFVVKSDAKISAEDEKMGKFDGDTLYFSMNVQDGGAQEPFRIGNIEYTSFSDYLANGFPDYSTDSNKDFGLRFLGMDAKEIPHYGEKTVVGADARVKTTKLKPADIKNFANKKDYIYLENAHKDTDDITFVTFDSGKTWNELMESKPSGLDMVYTFLLAHEEGSVEDIQMGHQQQKAVAELVRKSTDHRILIDATNLAKNPDGYPTEIYYDRYASDFNNSFKSLLNRFFDDNMYRQSGFRLFGMDPYKRFLGAVYLKVPASVLGDGTEKKGEVWINLSKYMIAHFDGSIEVWPDYSGEPQRESSFGFAPDIFGLHTYSYRNRKYFDAIGNLQEDIDDRRKIQKQITGRTYEDLRDWSVMIGDSLFIVPPTSIRSINRTTSEQMPLMRARGAVNKGQPKSQRMIELTLYFNAEEGINGVPYKANLPNGDQVTYYMNGLRSLIAQFRLTPFLPIENTHINHLLNIDAVTLTGLQIATLPDYPKCLAATLMLQEFEYRVFMPELQVDVDRKDTDESYNVFSSTINWEVMRWHYQQALMRGEDAAKYNFNSKEHILLTMGGKSALMPSKFDSSLVEFYVPDENDLMRRKQIKLEAQKAAIDSVPEQTASSLQLAGELAEVYEAIKELRDSSVFEANVKGLSGHGDFKTYMRKNVASAYYFYTGKQWDIDGSESNRIAFQTNKIIPIFNQIVSAVSETESKILSGGRIKTTVKSLDQKDLYEGIIEIILDMSLTNYSHQDIESIKSVTSLEAEEKVFDNNSVTFRFSGQFQRVVASNDGDLPRDMVDAFEIVRDFRFINNGDYKALQAAALIDATDDFQASIPDMKQDIDLETLDSLTFVQYDLGDLELTSSSISMSNIVSEMSLNGIDGYAPQFMGGHDMMIELTFQTTDKYNMVMLQDLPRESSRMVREYREVLSQWPLRIKSQLTGMAGIYDVLVQNVEVNTVPNHPGLYSIAMTLISVDRTLRNREALKRLEIPIRSGYDGNHIQNTVAFKTQLDMNEALAQAPLYPDLELPTIGELEKAGFFFIRNLQSKSEHYADPDFYFVYGDVLTSEIFRETIVNFFSKHGDDETILQDGVGGEVRAKMEDGTIKVIKENNVARRGSDTTTAIMESVEDDTAKLAQEEQERYAKAMRYDSHEEIREHVLATGSDLRWDVTDKIGVLFLEEKYEDMIKSPKEEEVAFVDSFKSSVFTPIVNNINTLLQEPLKEETYSQTDSSYWGPGSLGDLMPVAKDAVARLFSGDNISFSQREFDHGDGLINVTTSTAFATAALALKLSDQKAWAELLFAAACGLTGEKEYQAEGSGSWRPMTHIGNTPYNRRADNSFATTAEEAADPNSKSIVFGATAIQMVTNKEYVNITGKRPKRNDGYVFLDDYYANQATDEEIYRHKINLMTNPTYAFAALARDVMFWARKYAEAYLLPSYYLATIEDNQHNISRIQTHLVRGDTGLTMRELDHSSGPMLDPIEKELFEQLGAEPEALKNGVLFAIVNAAVTRGDEGFMKLIKNRDYYALNDIVAGVNSADDQHISAEERPVYMRFRKFVRALASTSLADGLGAIGAASPNPASELKILAMEKVFLEAAQDPKQYILHSFYDMVVNDGRGRMLRAFPTFYMLMLDEGSRIGMWKLHDNFYNVNAIQSMQITKSRKNPADLAEITMSNMFKSYTTDDEDTKESFEYDFRDVFSRVFRPYTYFRKEDIKRRSSSTPERVKLQTGIRIHLKMGYGSNASVLPTMFNGTVTELNVGESITLIAQGDGMELATPIMMDEDGDNMPNRDKFFIPRFFQNFLSDGASPKAILNALLTAQGGWLKKIIRDKSDGRFFNQHPFGIINFGDPNVKVIFNNGEPTQNIYEAIDTPKWGEGQSAIASEYSVDSPPKISMSIFGKSFWDILHICGSTSPDFIVGTAPFGMRSTVFHGAPHYYYAYDYVGVDDVIYEKRKPFQQYHIYTSFSDIIANNISTSEMTMKTAAVGLYDREGWMSGGVSDKVGPIWADFEIYPERQKSMTIDTQLYSKGISRAARIVPFWNSVNDKLSNTRGKKNAWRMTAHALKEAMKEMYQGELMIIGDPTVKPHDRMFIYDTYENMTGQCLVESVSHVMSLETGFISAVYADAITVVDDQHEMAKQTLAGGAAARGAAVAGCTIAASAYFGKTATPITTVVDKLFIGSVDNIADMIDKIGKIVPEEKVVKVSPKRVGVKKKMAKAAKKRARLTGKVFKDGVKGIKGKFLAKVGASSLSGPLGIAVLMAIEIGVFMVATGLVYEFIERKMKSYRAIQVFPLKKDGRAYTAGLNGSKGIIYGSPSYNDGGMLGDLFVNLTQKKQSGEGLNDITNFLKTLFVTENIDNIVKTTYMRNHSQVDENGDFLMDDSQIGDLFQSIAANEIHQYSTYQSSIRVPRTDDPESERIFYRYAVMEPDSVEFAPDQYKHLVPVRNIETIEKHMNNGNFFIAHNESIDKTFSISFDSQPEELKSIYVDGLYDLPILDKNLVSIIGEACNRYFGNTGRIKTDDQVILVSALRPGAKSYKSTGFICTLQVSDIATFINVMDEIVAEQTEIAAGRQYIMYEKTDIDQIKIFLCPPKNLIG